MVEQALRYRARGLPVFPVCTPIDEQRCQQHGQCKNSGKHPLVGWEAFQKRVPAEQEVRSWWRKWPTASIGMATGALSKVVVLDADGAEARKEALRRGVPPSPTIWTGRQEGVHYWLQHPGRKVGNFAKKFGGLDFRGDGGYVLLPPSLHWTGNTYRWADNSEDLPLPVVPPWLLKILDEPSTPKTTGADASGPSVDLVRLLNGIPEGERNSAIWSFAGKLRNEDIPRVYAEFMVRQAARACRPPLEDDIALDQVRRAYERYAPEPTWDSPEEITDPFAAGEVEIPPFEILDAADFLVRAYPPIEWRIQGFLREHALVWLFGAPGTIKTYIATDAALAVATGSDFLGQFKTVPGKVLIVEEDTLSVDYQQAYLAPMVKAWGLEPEALRGKLFVAPPSEFRLDHPARVQELCIWIVAHQPALVIFDAWYLLHETDGYGKELKKVLAIARRIRAQYGCAVWIVDHNRKAGREGAPDGEDAVDRLFGGREKGAAADAILEARGVKGESGCVFLHVVKLRGARPAEPLRIVLNEGQLLIDGTTEETPTGSVKQVYQWLCEEGGSRTKVQIIRGTRLSERSVDTACGTLMIDGRVREAGRVGRAKTYLALHIDVTETNKGGVPW